jgi:hypothetical protein
VMGELMAALRIAKSILDRQRRVAEG